MRIANISKAPTVIQEALNAHQVVLFKAIINAPEDVVALDFFVEDGAILGLRSQDVLPLLVEGKPEIPTQPAPGALRAMWIHVRVTGTFWWARINVYPYELF